MWRCRCPSTSPRRTGPARVWPRRFGRRRANRAPITWILVSRSSDWPEVVDFGDAFCPHGMTEVSHANIKERVHRRIARDRAGDSGRRSFDHLAVGDGGRRCARLRQRGHRALRRTPTPPTSSTEPGQPRHSDAAPHRVGCSSGNPFQQVGLRGYWPPQDNFRMDGEQGMTAHQR